MWPSVSSGYLVPRSSPLVSSSGSLTPWPSTSSVGRCSLPPMPSSFLPGRSPADSRGCCLRRDVAGGQVHQLEPGRDPVRLSALARPRRTQQHHPHALARPSNPHRCAAISSSMLVLLPGRQRRPALAGLEIQGPAARLLLDNHPLLPGSPVRRS